MLEDALIYLKGVSIIPIGKDKKPFPGFSWKEFQTRKATEEEVRGWFAKWPYANIGIVTGKLSNLVVVDVEAGGSVDDLPDTQKARTGNGGWHYYYEYAPGVENSARIRPLTDIRGEGGFVVAPPSITQYKNKDGKIIGGKYEWLNRCAVQPFPVDLFGPKAKSDWKEKITAPIAKGSRNVSFTAIIGGLLSKFPQEDWESVVWSLVQTENNAQSAPLSFAELRTTFNSIAARERQKRASGGDIKDIVSEIVGDEIEIKVTLNKSVVHFKVKNIISSLLEALAVTWIEKTSLGEEISFRLKLHSDTNREQWVRILSKAFDRREDKEVYPWTIIVAKVAHLVEVEIQNKKQAFVATEIEAKKAEWLLEPFVQEDQINTIFGLGGSGKTLLSLFFAKFIVQNNGAKILFIDYEDTAGGWKDKLVKVSSYEGIRVDLENFIYFDSEQIPLADQVDKIKEEIRKRNVRLVIVDSASRATGTSTSDEEAAIRLVCALKTLRTTVLLIAHQRKNDGDKTPMGSIQYENQSRNVWNVKSSLDDKNQNIFHCACTHTKANNTFLRREPVGYRVEYTDTAINIVEESAKSYFSEKFSIKDRIKELLKDGGMDYKEIAETLGVDENSVKKNLSEGKAKMLWINREGRWFIS